MGKRHLEGSTMAARAEARKTLGSLKSLMVQPVTRARYAKAREDFYSWLKDERLILPHQTMVSDYLEALWAQGKGRTEGSNILAGLQDVQPHLKGKLKMSWRLMKTWVTHEIPNRAPPLPLDCLHAMVGYSLFKGWQTFGLSLLLGFHGLLRTGELLGVLAKHVAVSKPQGPAVISLGLTKSGKRQGAAESITVYAEDVCRRLYQWKEAVKPMTSLTGASHVWRSRFTEVLTALGFEHFDFRPYSLRRGGATHLFQLQGKFDSIMVLGRWQAASTARLYINNGLSVLAEITLPWNHFSRTLRKQYLTSLTKFLPKLEHTSQASQKRGRWKGAKKGKSRGCISTMG